MIRLATAKDYPALIDVWEQAVRATHHFLPEDYLQEIKRLLPGIFPAVPVYVYENDEKELLAFTGVANETIEMLFLHPTAMGKGIGRMMLQYSIEILGGKKLEVNEQNEQAVAFYQHMGFHITGRKELDGLNRPFPLLIMEYRS
ncbi:MAG: GNAT family N-acetyltransferase [Chitinophagaceae bacterium]|nr:GNAT family N-acetyltransferase [Chitinophagaceae bacterium]